MALKTKAAVLLAGSSLVLSGAGTGLYAHLDGAREAKEVAKARRFLDADLLAAPEIRDLKATEAAQILEEIDSEKLEVRHLRYLARAIEDFQRGDFVLARRQLELASASGPTPKWISIALDRAQGHANAARSTCSADLREPRALVVCADLALDDRDPRQAAQFLDTIGPPERDSTATANRRGIAAEQLGNLKEAETAFARAIATDSKNLDAHINHARVRRAKGDHHGALASFSRALELAPGSSDAWLGLGLTRAALGDTNEAFAAFTRASELDPRSSAPWLAAGDLLRDLRRYDEAIRSFRTAIEHSPDESAAWLKLGNALFLHQDYRAAVDAFERALAIAPTLAAAHNGRGASLTHLERFEEAAASLRQAAALDSRDPNPLLNLALLYERRGFEREVERAWDAAIERDPTVAELRGRI